MQRINVRNVRIDEDEFMRMREGVLSLWPTGKEVVLEEAFEYVKSLPETKIFYKIVEKLKKEGRTTVLPRAGTPLLEDMIRLCNRLVDSGIVLIPVTLDSYTRLLQFKKVEMALKESEEKGKPLLNGYPLVNYGVHKTRKLIENVNGAFTPRGVNRPLPAEIAFASGMTGIPVGLFITFGCYEKTKTLEDTLMDCRYIWRLIGCYADQGIIIACDSHGWIPTGVFPQSVHVATIIAESLMCAEQGGKCIIPMPHLMGNLAQDIAYARITKKLLREYLDRFGYKDVLVPGTIVAQIPLYPVPQDVGEVFAYLNYSVVAGVLGGVEVISLRSIDEGVGVPTEEAHAMSYRSANWMINILREQHIKFEIQGLQEEERIAEAEVRAILEKLLEMGDGDIVVGCIRGVEEGVIDSPFSPNKNVKDKVLGVKDLNGAVRYLEFGNLPIPEEIKEFHRKKIAEREEKEKRKMDYYVSIEDFWAFSKGHMIGARTGN